MPVDNVCDLGVIIDSKLTMESHVQSIARSCFYQLRQLRSIQQSLTANARRLLAVAFIASRVDYCNAVLFGIPNRVVQQLQMVMNAAAHFVARTGKFAHITPVLRDVLHWLPVSKKTQFKVALLAFDCVRGMGLTYFTRVCVPVSDNTARSSLRSAQCGDLFVPKTRTKLGTRSFHVAAPTVWNSLPTELRSTSVSRDTFKSRLKSHFYADAYLHQV